MIRRCRPLLGTFVEITVPSDTHSHVIEDVFEHLSILEAYLSYFKADSEVSKINRLPAKKSIEVSCDTFAILSFAQELSTKSNGIFDITVGSTLIQKGFLPSSHSHFISGIWSDIILEDDSRITLKKEVCIDLGGIAKGFAVDKAVGILLKNNISNGSVNAGGDLRVFGQYSDSMLIRHPNVPTQKIHLDNILYNNAAATSAGYYSKIQNMIPIVHPHSRDCIQSSNSVTVVAPSCMIADALTKIVMISPDTSLELLNLYEARAFLIQHNPLTDEVHIFDSYQS